MIRMMALIAAITVLGAGGAQAQGAAYPTEYPFPKGHLRTGQELIFCIDKRNPMWEVQQDIARELAWQLGREPAFHVTYEADQEPKGYTPAATRKEFLVLLASKCDVYMGLPGSINAAFDYPADEEMLATRPFYRSRFVLVSRQGEIDSVDDVPADLPFGLQARGIPYMLLLTMRPDSVTPRRYVNDAELVEALRSGEVEAGIVYAPELYSRIPEPEKAGLQVHTIESIPNMEWFIVGSIRQGRPALRQKVDEAITRLLQQDRVGRILASHGLPLEVFEPARPGEELPDDDDDFTEERDLDADDDDL